MIEPTPERACATDRWFREFAERIECRPDADDDFRIVAVRAAADRPCCSPTRNHCRARGPQQMKPVPWNPSHGWFLMPLPGEQ